MDWGRLAVRALALVVAGLVVLRLDAVAGGRVGCGLFARGGPGEGC